MIFKNAVLPLFHPQLAPQNIKVENLEEDLKTGVNLIVLVRPIGGGGRLTAKPEFRDYYFFFLLYFFLSLPRTW